MYVDIAQGSRIGELNLYNQRGCGGCLQLSKEWAGKNEGGRQEVRST